MLRIKGRGHALRLLRRRASLRELAKTLSARVERIDIAVISYYERNNKKELRDPETGILWQKRQGTTQVYDEKALKKLLKDKGVALSTVFKERIIEDRDDDAIFKLLKDEVLTLDDIESVSHLQSHKPYLTGLEPKGAAKKKSAD